MIEMTEFKDDVSERHRMGRAVVIRRVDAIPIRIPLSKPMSMAHATFTKVENLLVRIEAEDGSVGWGEAASAPSLTGETWQGMIAVVQDHFAPALRGEDARQRARLLAILAKLVFGASGAKSAVEMALVDLVAQSYGLPCALLLGGLYRDRVKPMWLLGNAKPEDDIQEAKHRELEGYRLLKLKAGVRRLEVEIDLARAIRSTIGEGTRLCADANSGFDPSSARRYLSGTIDVGLSYLEQPFPQHQLTALAALAHEQPVPICADQSVHSIDDIHEQAAHGVRGVSLKLNKLGGLAVCLQAATICDQKGLTTLLAAKVAETSIASAAIIHLACVVPNTDWGVSLTHSYLAEDVVRTPLSIVDGAVSLPPGPGWGIDVSESAVDRLRIH